MRSTILLVALATLMIPASLADSCTPASDPTTVYTCELAPDVGAGCYYVVSDNCQPDCLFSIWIYQETNGIDGLQRGDDVQDDTCGGTIAPDTDIF